MKKINIFSVLIILIAFAIVSCNSNKPAKPVLKNQLDSLNYAFGVANGDGIKNYYLQGDFSDETIKSLIKGMNDGLKSKVEKEHWKFLF